MNQADWDLYIKSSKQHGDRIRAYKKKKKEDEVVFGDKNDTTEKPKEGGFWNNVKGIGVGAAEGLAKGTVDIGEGLSNLGQSVFAGKVDKNKTKKFQDARNSIDKWGAENDSNDIADFVGNLPGQIVKSPTDWGSFFARGVRNVPEIGVGLATASSKDKNLAQAGDEKMREVASNIFGEDIASRGAGAMAMETGGQAINAVTDIATGGLASAPKKVGEEVVKKTVKDVFKTAVKAGAANAATGVPASILQQSARGQEITPESLGKEAAIQFGTGVVGGGFSAAKNAKAINKKIDLDAANPVKPDIDAPFNEIVDDLNNQKAVAAQKEIDDAARQVELDDINAKKQAEWKDINTQKQAEYEQIQSNLKNGLNEDGTRFINVDDTKRQLDDMQSGKFTDDLYDTVTSDGQPADPEFIKNATQKQIDILTKQREALVLQVDQIESPIMRESAMRRVNELDDKINSLSHGDSRALMEIGDSGVTRQLNVEKVRDRFKQLNEDLNSESARVDIERANAEKRNAPRKSYNQVSQEIDALGAGGVAPEAVTPRADFTTIDEVAGDSKVPAPQRAAATKLFTDARDIEMQRSTLMTPAKAKRNLDAADIAYNEKMAIAEAMPEPRRTAEVERIKSEYEAYYNEVTSKQEADAAEVAELNRNEEQIVANSHAVLADTNLIKDANPTEFGEVDEKLNAKVSQEIEEEAKTAIFNRMSNEEGVPDAENVSKAFAEIPEGVTAEVLDNSTAANNLAQEALTDLWTNDEANLLEHSLQGVSRSSLGLELSSPSHNIRRMFGEIGRLVNGSILEAFQKTNLASKHDAALFTKIQKAFGGDRAVYKAAVDIVEGKLDVNDAGFTKQQLDGLEMFHGFWERSKRMVKRAAAQEVMADFDARSYNGDFKYKTEEIKSLAKRDGISIAEATQKYSGNTGFKKSDVIYLANQASNKSTRQNYFAHMLDEELVSKNVKQEFRDSVAERQLSGEFRYTDDELAILASRDGTGIEAARAKYGERGLNKRDAKYVESIIAHDAVTRAKKDFGGDAVTANIKFGNMMNRLTDSDNYSRDIIDVMARYSAGLNKKVYLEPALRKLDNAKLVLEKSKIETKVAKDWINTYEKQLKISGVSKTGEAFNEAVDALIRKAKPDSSMIGNNHYRSSLAAQRLINTFGMLGLSFRNGLQQTSQIVTAVGKLGWENVAPGMIEHVKSMSNPKTRAAYRESLERASIINAGFVDDAFTDLIGSTRAKAVQDTGEFLSKYLMLMSRVTDEFVRGTTYQAALRDGLSSKLPMGKAQTRAAAMAAELNFLTTKADMPTKLNSDGIRSLTQFLTFSYKQAEAWKDIGIDSVKDPVTGALKFKPKELQRVLQGIVTAGVAFQLMENVAGIDTEDNIPFLGNFTDGSLPMSPLMSLTIGRENQPGIPQLLNDIANPDGADDYEREQYRQDSMEKFRDMLISSFVPAGSQIKKSITGFESAQGDGVVSKDGKVKFIQNTDDASKLKATLFGQYSTDAGREWINKKFPTLSEKQSEILNAQKTAESKQRAYDFYSGLKATTTKGTVKSRIKDIMATQPAKAERLIRDHNDSVQKAVQSYTSKYGELSQQEQDYLISNHFITNGNLENITDNIEE